VSRLPAFFVLLTLVGGAAVVGLTLRGQAGLADAEAAAVAPALLRSPVPSLAPPAVPAADRVRAPIPKLPPRVPPQPVPAAPSAAEQALARRQELEARIEWRTSHALGTHGAGRLADGVLLPHEGVHFFTWDPVLWTAPNRDERRHGTDRLVRTILRVAAEYAAANPDAPRVAVGDLSLPHGGSFDARHGIVGEFGPGRGTLGHVSHQNGLDVDIYYPRLDRAERAPDSLEEIDLRLAQDLVDRFVAAGAQFVFVGPRTGLTGPPAIVQPTVRHDDHLHVRLPAP
jgi:hypothetical protein